MTTAFQFITIKLNKQNKTSSSSDLGTGTWIAEASWGIRNWESGFEDRAGDKVSLSLIKQGQRVQHGFSWQYREGFGVVYCIPYLSTHLNLPLNTITR